MFPFVFTHDRWFILQFPPAVMTALRVAYGSLRFGRAKTFSPPGTKTKQTVSVSYVTGTYHTCFRMRLVDRAHIVLSGVTIIRTVLSLIASLRCASRVARMFCISFFWDIPTREPRRTSNVDYITPIFHELYLPPITQLHSQSRAALHLYSHQTRGPRALEGKIERKPLRDPCSWTRQCRP